ncbi:MAG: flagellar type III secretion system pore protein FliP [Alphaproteobacteria bacterium]|nr:flagellar type III secretion system pore protein FliP [Alphaproteobacteria bacterium]
MLIAHNNSNKKSDVTIWHSRLLWKLLPLLLTASALIMLMILPAHAQSVNIDLGQGGTLSARVIQLIVLITIISLAPSLLMMVTSFTRIVVVMSLLRTALGTQGAPPNNVLVSLALFMTLFIMQPVFEQIYNDGLQPLLAEEIDEQEAFVRSVAPVRVFMMDLVRPDDLNLFLELAAVETVETPEDVPLRALIPAFMISELKRAFEIGFLLFVPFVLIDMLIASILMSMGMMMLPPVIISLPFKLIFFVLVDGWALVVGSLVKSFG